MGAQQLKVAPAIQPRALSITQGRAVGVAHYLLGGIATTWSFFLARLLQSDNRGGHDLWQLNSLNLVKD